MIDTALILAAHGSRHAAHVNRMLREYAARLAGMGRFDRVEAAFHHGRPGFAEVLDLLRPAIGVVVPVMTSAGYYSGVVLPRELARNRCFARSQVTITDPVGAHPGMGQLIESRLSAYLGTTHIAASDLALVLIGHGTPRHPESRTLTEHLADALRRRAVCGEVLCAFIDDEPGMDTIPVRTTFKNLFVVPFLIAEGPHAGSDIPAALGLAGMPDKRLPAWGVVENRKVYVDSAVGTDPRIVDFILDLGCRGLQTLTDNVRGNRPRTTQTTRRRSSFPATFTPSPVRPMNADTLEATRMMASEGCAEETA